MVKLVVQVRLTPTPEPAEALQATLAACNEAATWVSRIAFDQGAQRVYALRGYTYTEIRVRWALGAGPGTRVT
ncbi:hypothetical protein [Streptomyces sp. NBC_00019]|uniref:hypothetical protein n=1 Tax=Streptomyces sp. NBC_00019 TaxID=2975623 RepID=UPI00324DFEF2